MDTCCRVGRPSRLPFDDSHPSFCHLRAQNWPFTLCRYHMSSLHISRLLFWLPSLSFIFRLAVGSRHWRATMLLHSSSVQCIHLVAWQKGIVIIARDPLHLWFRAFFWHFVWPGVLVSLISTMLNCRVCSHASQCLLDEHKPSNLHTSIFKSVMILTSLVNLTSQSRSVFVLMRKNCFVCLFCFHSLQFDGTSMQWCLKFSLFSSSKLLSSQC